MIDIKKIDPHHFWYVVGYIVTDGNLSKDGRHVDITSKDRSHVFAIRRLLNLTCKVGFKTRGSSKEKVYSRIQISDVNFYRYLLNLGLIPRKSLTLGKIEVAQKYFPDFLRGVIDGDGTINTWVHRTNGCNQWALRIVSAAPTFANWMKNEIESTFDVKGKIYNHKYKDKKNFINIVKFGKLATKVIIRKTYYQGAFSLSRKNKIAALCLQDENKMVNYGSVLGPGAVIGSQTRLKIE